MYWRESIYTFLTLYITVVLQWLSSVIHEGFSSPPLLLNFARLYLFCTGPVEHCWRTPTPCRSCERSDGHRGLFISPWTLRLTRRWDSSVGCDVKCHSDSRGPPSLRSLWHRPSSSMSTRPPGICYLVRTATQCCDVDTHSSTGRRAVNLSPPVCVGLSHTSTQGSLGGVSPSSAPQQTLFCGEAGSWDSSLHKHLLLWGVQWIGMVVCHSQEVAGLILYQRWKTHTHTHTDL